MSGETGRDAAFEDGARGCLLGLAVGDALGLPYEGAPGPGRAVEMVAKNGLPPGTTSDDTAQALALAESLAELGRFDADDFARRLVAWYRGGAPGIGLTTAKALSAMASGADWSSASRRAHDEMGGRSAGNGAIMRCAPLAILLRDDESALIEASAASARVTHWETLAGEAAAAVNLMLAAILRGETDRASVVADAAVALDMRAERLMPSERRGSAPGRVADSLREAATGSGSDLAPASGFALDTLRVATHFFLAAESFEWGLSRCVGLGGDADTNGAVAGALLGALFGEEGIPGRWASAVDSAARARELAARLVRMSGSPPTRGGRGG